MSARLDLHALTRLAADALVANRTDPANARLVADALVAADADGLSSHGVSRIPFYADQAASGKVDGFARPEVTVVKGNGVSVDARDGFAFPAIRAGLDRGLSLLSEHAVVGVTVGNSHHCGAAGYHVEYAARAGAVAIGFSNTPAGIAPWGGHRATFGTNPIAFACPRADAEPLVVDLSLSRVARGKVLAAARDGESIPQDWALDRHGRPTADPQAALEGTMRPVGGAKGAALALMVEILAAGLSGSRFGFEASSFFTATGPPPRVGQLFVLIDADGLAGPGFTVRVSCLAGHIEAQDGTRLPGSRRLGNRRRARTEGVEIPAPVYDDLCRLAARVDEARTPS